MKKKRKSRVWTRPKRKNDEYDISFKRRVAREYLDTGQSLAQVAMKFGITRSDVSNWKKRFSSELAERPNEIQMTEQEKAEMKVLQKQLKDLEKRLKQEQIRNFALETLVDLAKEEMGIDLRKNFGAKQPGE